VTGRPERTERVDKPWGHEEIFAVVEGSYCGKFLHVARGESLSLQYHHHKDETIALVTGRVDLDIGATAQDLHTVALTRGAAVHVGPGTLHRLRALEDSVLVEVSTAAPGWRQDIVRLEDRYGRGGSSTP
jgi:mannose-6-phosphate isomerase-like protein (cupin superfamily)